MISLFILFATLVGLAHCQLQTVQPPPQPSDACPVSNAMRHFEASTVQPPPGAVVKDVRECEMMDLSVSCTATGVTPLVYYRRLSPVNTTTLFIGFEGSSVTLYYKVNALPSSEPLKYYQKLSITQSAKIDPAIPAGITTFGIVVPDKIFTLARVKMCFCSGGTCNSPPTTTTTTTTPTTTTTTTPSIPTTTEGRPVPRTQEWKFTPEAYMLIGATGLIITAIVIASWTVCCCITQSNGRGDIVRNDIGMKNVAY